MYHGQPDEKGVLQDFHSWFDSAKVMGITDLLRPDGPSAQPDRTETPDPSPSDSLTSIARSPAAIDSPHDTPFSVQEAPATLSTVSAYFVPDIKVEEHLTRARLRKILYALWPRDPPVQVDTIATHYAKVFSILLRITKGYFIEHFVKHHSLRDNKLPFEAKPPNWPTVGDDFFEDFQRVQWMFCAPAFQYNAINQQLTNYILPIILKEDLARGATAVTSKIMLHPSYNQLDPPGNTEKSKANFFVIKTYCTRDAEEHYESEVSAYRKLRPGGNQTPGLIGFHGSFIHNGTFNIILEYADRRTMSEFFENVSPPSTAQDIRDFWVAMFNLVRAIFTIHNLQPQEDELEEDGPVEPTFRGWHQDVKPDNILVTSGGRKSDFGCQFKLADLGLCHFQRARAQRKGKKVLYQQEDSADGDTYGTRIYGAPEAYRPDDFIGTSRLLVGQKVDIWSLGCIYSEAAVWVLQGKEHLKRYREVRERETKQKGVKDIGCFHDGNEVLVCVERTHEEALKSKRECDFITQEVISMVDDMLDGQDLRPNAQQLWGKCQKILRKANSAAKDSKRQATGSSGQSRPKTPPASLPSHSEPSQSADTLARRDKYSPGGSSSRGRQGSRVEYCEPCYGGMPRCDSPSRRTTIGDLQSLTLGNGSKISPRPTLPERPLSTSDLQQGEHTQALDTMLNGVQGASATPSVLRRPSVRRKNLSELNVQEVLHWINQKKSHHNNPLKQMKAIGGAIAKNKLPPDLPNKDLLKQLNNRDHVFLIDDSDSMREHWTSVKIIFGILCYLVKSSDKDGVDLYFTRHPGTYNSPKSTELAQNLQDRRLDGPSDMEKSLRRILEKHSKELLAESKSKSRFGVRKKPANPMNLYVFTDGAWHSHCDASAPIQDFVKTLRERWDGRQPGGLSGIQFISFGNNTRGLEYLDYLDSGLLDLANDIVDTEPSTGNVWKMLLGAINKTFDADLDNQSTGRNTLDLSSSPSFAKPT